MAKGAECLWCGENTAHDKGTHKECSSCGAIYWDLWNMGMTAGQGKGKKCRHCGNETLHFLADAFGTDTHIYRCSICNATLITQDR